MNRRMPGFTADAGLGAASSRYRQRDVEPAVLTTGYSAQARLVTSPTVRGKQPCIPNCICITQEGCMCCPPGPVARPVRGNGWRLR
jgi:hypothetical protein